MRVAGGRGCCLKDNVPMYQYTNIPVYQLIADVFSPHRHIGHNSVNI